MTSPRGPLLRIRNGPLEVFPPKLMPDLAYLVDLQVVLPDAFDIGCKHVVSLGSLAQLRASLSLRLLANKAL